MAIVIYLEAEAVVACGRWRLATHSQQIVGGFSVGVTPSRVRPQDTLHCLSASAEPAVTSSLMAQSGRVLGLTGWFWCEQVVMEGWDTKSDPLSLSFLSNLFFCFSGFYPSHSVDASLCMFMPLSVLISHGSPTHHVLPFFLSLSCSLFLSLPPSVWARIVQKGVKWIQWYFSSSIRDGQ